MQETFRLAENYNTSFSGNTSFHGVSEYYPLTPVTAKYLTHVIPFNTGIQK